MTGWYRATQTNRSMLWMCFTLQEQLTYSDSEHEVWIWKQCRRNKVRQTLRVSTCICGPRFHSLINIHKHVFICWPLTGRFFKGERWLWSTWTQRRGEADRSSMLLVYEYRQQEPGRSLSPQTNQTETGQGGASSLRFNMIMSFIKL